MKHQKFILLLIAIIFSSSLIAQTSASNSLGIYPSTQTSFDPTGRFTGIGESGGSPGSTVDGCDLYGFRAQTQLDENVNLAMRRFQFSTISINLPNLQYETEDGAFWISEKTANSQFSFGGCADVLATFKKSTSGSMGNNVFNVLGSATAVGGIWEPSDRSLKQDIESISNALDIVKNLNGVTYTYRVDERPELNLPSGLTYGFITQEVAEVMPEAVRDAMDLFGGVADYDVMQYTQIIPVLTEAIKEQQVVIEDQQDRLAEQAEINEAYEQMIRRLEARITALENKENSTQTSTTELELEDLSIEGVSLRQNRPNPFTNETVIEYSIPTEMNSAFLVVYDINGKQLSSFSLEPGSGQVTLKAAALSSGVYFYTIENDGQAVARQKMIVK